MKQHDSRAGASLFAAWLGLTLPVSTTAAPREVPDSLPNSSATVFAQVQERWRARWHAAAYLQAVARADAGHADSARVALRMAREGVAKYGAAWPVSSFQLARWTALAEQTAVASAASSPRGASAPSAATSPAPQTGPAQSQADPRRGS